MANNVKNKLKETFNSTPRVVRWVLLAAAFVVVLILLFLLMNKPKPAPNPVAKQNREIKLIVAPTTANFSKVEIGKKGQQRFKIGATENAVVDTVRLEKPVDGFAIKKNSCKNEPVTKSINCAVDVTWTPSDPEFSDTVTLLIDWHAAGDSRETNQQTDKIEIPVGGVGTVVKQTKPVVAPEPVVEPEPVIDDEPSDTDDDFDIDDSDVADELVKDITDSRNILKQKPMPEPELPVKRAEKCSDFAMPGYSTSGAQIGWIKPHDGRYEFHPFSDKECNKPTGIYNPDTGIITSIDGKGRKIGTDADHVGGTFDVSALPKLKSKPGTVAKRTSNRQYTPGGMGNLKKTFDAATGMNLIENKLNKEALVGTGDAESVYSSMPYDRTFILRQFKPIPATIVSDVRADPSVYCPDGKTCDYGTGIPVRATVDRNVYSDNGRTIIIPTGTLLMGYLTGELPGPYKSIGRMQIKWYQFIRPDGVEFNFGGGNEDPYSADSQGRVGVPGYGSTDYIEQMVMPMLTAIIPAAVNMIAPIADTFVNQIDLDNNTVVQSGTVRSSELAKNEVISAWNKVAQKLMVDALDNTVPPFSIAAGTRITVYSPVDLVTTCGDGGDKKCAFHPYGSETRRTWASVKSGSDLTINPNDSSWIGQVRSFDMARYCTKDEKTQLWTVDQSKMGDIIAAGHDYRTALAYCQSQNYQGKTQAQYDAYYQNLTKNGAVNTSSYDSESKKVVTDYSNDEYNKKVLGLEYELDEEGNETGNIKNPFEKTKKPGEEAVGSVDCDGQAPDANGCCPGETLEDLGELGLNCCPAGGGDCFPPLDVN